MNIGITCYPTYGGSGAVATELGIELAKRGHCIHFISYNIPFRLNKFYKNIFYHEVDMLDYPLFKYPPYSLSLSAKMSEVIESEGLDLMHVHYAMPHAASAYLAKIISGKQNIKIVTTLHGTDITIVGNHHSFYKITKFSIEKSDGITCVSDYLRKETQEIFDLSKDMKVIHNFIDTDRYKKMDVKKENLGPLKEKEKIITHISNFRPVKKIDSIINAFSKIIKEVDCRLLLVGDGPDMGKNRALVEKLGVKDKVLFMGMQERIVPILSVSDIYMLPSKSESFGLSALEALSCSVPVIGTKIGGMEEVVQDGLNGYLFDPDDIESISDAAISILMDDQKRYDMGQKARSRAEEFDDDVIVPIYEEYYNNVLKT